MNSTAAASLMCIVPVWPQALAAASVRSGRSRLPPESTRYRARSGMSVALLPMRSWMSRSAAATHHGSTVGFRAGNGGPDRSVARRSAGALMAFSEDGFLGGRIVARQLREGFRSGTDAVMLAAAVFAKAGDDVLELGCGAGI